MKHFTVLCQTKFLTCEISDFTPCAHAHSNILHIKYAAKTDDCGLGVWRLGKCVGLEFGLG